MSEEILSNFGRDQGEGLGESEVKSSHRPCHELAQTLFDDRPAGLDRAEVRGTGREVSYLGTGGFNQFFHPFYFVGGEIVHHHHLPGPQCRAEHFIEVG